MCPKPLCLACCGGDGNGSGDGDGDGDSGEDGDGGAQFASDGVSRGVFESISLTTDESFAGLLNQMEIAVRFDAANGRFIGSLRNEAQAAVCAVRVSIQLDGAQTLNQTSADSPFALPGLRRFGRTDFEFPAPGASFSEWTAIVETLGCTSAPTGAFRGPVENPTSSTICQSRTEIHLGVGA